MFIIFIFDIYNKHFSTFHALYNIDIVATLKKDTVTSDNKSEVDMDMDTHKELLEYL